MSSPSDWQCVHNGWEQEESPHKIWHKLQHCVYIIDPCLLERFPWLLSLPKSEMGTNQDHIKPYTYFTFRPINSTLRLCTCTCLCHKKKPREKMIVNNHPCQFETRTLYRCRVIFFVLLFCVFCVRFDEHIAMTWNINWIEWGTRNGVEEGCAMR